jgi:hypothetical protein
MFPAKRRVRAWFTVSGERYVLSVTDPKVTGEFLQGANGETEIKDALLGVSLGEAFHGHAYKRRRDHLALAHLSPQVGRQAVALLDAPGADNDLTVHLIAPRPAASAGE